MVGITSTTARGKIGAGKTTIIIPRILRAKVKAKAVAKTITRIVLTVATVVTGAETARNRGKMLDTRITTSRGTIKTKQKQCKQDEKYVAEETKLQGEPSKGQIAVENV